VFCRRLSRQADDLQAWLDDLANRSLLEGAAYGIRIVDDRVQAMVFFRNHWFITDDPEAFAFGEDVEIRLLVADKPPPQATLGLDERKAPLPLVAVMPSGEFVPDGRLEINSEGSDGGYRLSWSHDRPGIRVDRLAVP
jgi:hypothetical protein